MNATLQRYASISYTLVDEVRKPIWEGLPWPTQRQVNYQKPLNLIAPPPLSCLERLPASRFQAHGDSV